MYVFGKLEGLNLPKPTHYYAGIGEDASWFDVVNDEFGSGSLIIKMLDRTTVSICMSGTEVRTDIMNGHDSWKEYVPPVLIEFIEHKFPEELRVTK